jgi:hypothetical protein
VIGADSRSGLMVRLRAIRHFPWLSDCGEGLGGPEGTVPMWMGEKIISALWNSGVLRSCEKNGFVKKSAKQGVSLFIPHFFR